MASSGARYLRLALRFKGAPAAARRSREGPASIAPETAGAAAAVSDAKAVTAAGAAPASVSVRDDVAAADSD